MRIFSLLLLKGSMRFKKILLLSVLLWFCSLSLFSQEADQTRTQDSIQLFEDYKAARVLFLQAKFDASLKKIDSIIQEADQKGFKHIWARSLMVKANCERRQYKYTFEHLAAYYHRIFDEQERTQFADANVLSTTYFSFAQICFNFGRYEEALKNHQKAYTICVENNLKRALKHRPIGSVYEKLGEYDKAITYFKRTMQLYEEDAQKGLYDAKFVQRERMYLTKDIAEVYLFINEPAKAEPYLLEALDLFQNAVKLKPLYRGATERSFLKSQFVLYHQQDKFDQAEAALAQWKQTIERAKINRPTNRVELLNSYASIAKKKGNLQRAETFYDSILLIEDKRIYRKSFNYMLTPAMEFFIENDRITKAQSIIEGIFEQYKVEEMNPNDIIAQDPRYFMDALGFKVSLGVKQFEIDARKEYLDEAFQWVNFSYAFIANISSKYGAAVNDEYNLKTLNRYSLMVCQNLFELTQDDHYLAKALEIMEFNKSFDLNVALKNNKAKIDFGIPKNLSEAQANVRARILAHKEDLKRIRAKDSLTKLVYKAFEEMDSISQIIHEKFPQYARLQQMEQTVPIKDLKKQLNKSQTTLVSYFYDAEYLFVCLIGPERLSFQKIKLERNMDRTILDFLNSIKSPANTEFESIRSTLEDLVVAPISEDMVTDRLLILPHKKMNFLPFDLLLAPPSNSSSGVTSLKELSYSYSLLNWMDKRINTSGSDVMVFAPVFDGEKTEMTSRSTKNSPLLYSVDESEHIAENFETSLYLREKATKSAFLADAKKAKVLHLATHVNLDQKDVFSSAIALSGREDLQFYEIFGLDLSAEMIVLSACETGVGEIRNGEGVKSLARSFAYAGAKSTVMSLWKVDDRSTSELMKYFYQHLKNGERKDEALRNAKLDYLANTDDELLQHPYYWAGFILSGDTSPVAPSNQWWWLAGIGLILGGGLTFRKKLFKAA